MNSHFYAIRLEKIFSTQTPDIELDADSFDTRPAEALKEALEHWQRYDIINEELKEDIIESINLPIKSLHTYLYSNSENAQKLEELIDRLVRITKK